DEHQVRSRTRHRIQQHPRLPDVLTAGRREVYDRVDAGHGGREPVAGVEVADDVAVAGSAAEDAHLVPAVAEHLDGGASEAAGAAGDQDDHGCPFSGIT